MVTAPPAADAIVLAGGASTRMGDADKLHAVVGGRAVVRRVVDACAAALDGRIVVAAGSGGHVMRPDDIGLGGLGERLHICADVPDVAGPAGGVVAAVSLCVADTVVVVAGDLPLLAPDALQQAVALLPTEADALVPVDGDGWRQVGIVVWRREALRAAASRMAHTSRPSLRGLLDGVPTCDVAAVRLGQTWVLDDVDTPEDLRRVRAALASRPQR